jgi:outer membrane protein
MFRIAIIVLLSGCLLHGLTASGQNEILENYIQTGFEQNLALQQKQLNYNQSLQVLNQAKALFFPDLGFSARYTVADGGRTIDFPVGDLMNPVYTTLNQLTQSQQFPQIENEKIYFVRPTEQETKLSLMQPLFHPEIFFNYKIQKALSNAANIDVSIYKRELVKEIKTAYYNYLKTVKAKKVFQQTLDVVQENVRVNESLYKNDKVTLDVVYRSRSELSKIEREIAEVEDLHARSRSYFNFLLNRSLDSDIIIMDEALLRFEEIPAETDAMAIAIRNREELQQLQAYQNASSNNLKRYKFHKAPTLGLAVDYGIQGEHYNFDPDADFVFASIVLQWDIFKGFENRSRIKEASIKQDILNKQYLESENQIKLQVTDSWYGVNTAKTAVETSVMEKESANKAFELISKRYYVGKSSLLEFIDARTTMTRADLTLVIAHYDYEISLAELERTLALYPLN